MARSPNTALIALASIASASRHAGAVGEDHVDVVGPDAGVVERDAHRPRELLAVRRGHAEWWYASFVAP